MSNIQRLTAQVLNYVNKSTNVNLDDVTLCN